jgi:hypothetical protein
MSDFFVTDILSLLVVLVEMRCFSKYTGLEYHTGTWKIVCQGLLCITKNNSSIDAYLTKKHDKYLKDRGEELTNDKKKDEIKQAREIYRLVVFKYVYVPRCIVGWILLIVELIILVLFTEDIIGEEFIGIVAVAGVFILYSLGSSIFILCTVKIERSKAYWHGFSETPHDVSLSVYKHYLILICYKILDIIVNALLIYISVKLLNEGSFSEPLPIIALALNSLENFIDVCELVTLCINACYHCREN